MIGAALLAVLLSAGAPPAACPCAPAPYVDQGGCLDLPTSAVVRVYDGDTLTVEIPDWPPIFRQVSIRADGYDAPEIRGHCEREKLLAQQARVKLLALLAAGHRITLGDLRPGKYFRLVADLEIDGQPVAAVMIGAGLAHPYNGGTRVGWCP